MANILYGSSNIYRNFKRNVEKGLFTAPELKLVNCTRKTVLDAHVATLEVLNLMVTCVLPNFIVDVCDGVPDSEVDLFAKQQVTGHVETLLTLSQKFQTANFVVVPPIFRSDPGWFGPHLPGLLAHLSSEIARVGSPRIAAVDPFVVVLSMLEDDGIHLTVAGGDQFLSHLDSQLARLLVPLPIAPDGALAAPDRLDLILAAVNRNASQLESVKTLADTVSNLESSTSLFETYVRVRHQNDDFIFARMKEESDAEVNRSREDRVCITGLNPPTGLSSHKEKKDHYLANVNRLVAIACAALPDTPTAVDVYVNLRKNLGQHLVEVRFDSRAGALAFRREAVTLAKANHAEFSTLFFTNSVTQSTRVRIEILRVLAKKLSTATELSFVQGFVPRPVLHYRSRPEASYTADGVGRSYTFVDAMGKFGSRLTAAELLPAYLRAGSTFNGSLSQYFVVLSESCQPPFSRPSRRQPRGGRRAAPVGRRAAPAGPWSAPGGRWFGVPPPRGLKRLGDPPVSTPSKKKETINEQDQDQETVFHDATDTPSSASTAEAMEVMD